MIRQIVLVSFKPDTSDDQITECFDAMKEMCESCEEVISFSLGKNIGDGPNHHDAALVADFEHIHALRRYTGGDKHRAYVENYTRHVTAKLAAIQHKI